METEIPVRDIMTRPVITADADIDILSAAKRMGSANVGSLIIVSADMITGILTERDLVRKVVAQGADPRNLRVRDIMSSPVTAIEPDASLRDAAALMLRAGVKRLPVIHKGKLVGIITDTDLISGSSLGLNDILSDLLEMHRESIHFEQPRGAVSGICEVCGQLSDNLENVNGELLCWSCRDGNR
ncbi:MAG TPA: CBS domain-containing protein [Methanothrix sp.]|jgi:CBS domain-containing protein|uniref:CBS domain-containing protein n=1 Tax=Methanothrix sp. TaxID=90426 RepID=UPI002C952908|nr:CBS domain-containing protein [Methanothrix sp.]MDI9416868.1 CBS domain-containing protein [Euryarchaeota archaeon]HON35713.1 CBS domain-containing protein [Methanothrix sp.]HRU75043.1 CBS domain-containing protein [Methanothrix sp.]